MVTEQTLSFFDVNPFFIPLISIIIAFIGTILGFYYFHRTTKARAAVDKQNYKLQLENAADKKRSEEQSLAKELKEDNKRLALDVKDAMITHVGNIVGTLKADIELQKTILLSEINLMKKDYSQVRTDMMYHIENQQIINERMQKAIDFMNQFLWGAGAKSTPPFVEGETETQEHKDKPSEGIFMPIDSTETQATKDKNPDSTKSEDIKDLTEHEKEGRKRKYGNKSDKKEEGVL